MCRKCGFSECFDEIHCLRIQLATLTERYNDTKVKLERVIRDQRDTLIGSNKAYKELEDRYNALVSQALDYLAAVNGRREFRQALREGRKEIKKQQAVVDAARAWLASGRASKAIRDVGQDDWYDAHATACDRLMGTVDALEGGTR